MSQHWHGPILKSATICFHTSHLYITFLVRGTNIFRIIFRLQQ